MNQVALLEGRDGFQPFYYPCESVRGQPLFSVCTVCCVYLGSWSVGVGTSLVHGVHADEHDCLTHEVREHSLLRRQTNQDHGIATHANRSMRQAIPQLTSLCRETCRNYTSEPVSERMCT